MAGTPWRQALLQGNGLARRMLVSVLLFSSLITALITAFELYGTYRRDLRAIDSAFEFVGSNYLPSLANSVWNLDDAQVQSQLDALVSLPDVEYIAILDGGRERWHAGRAVSRRTKETRIALLHAQAGAKPIGEVRIVASLDRVLQRVLARLVEVLLANGLKTMLVAVFLLLCFQSMVTQHLARIADFVRHIDPRAGSADTLALERRGGGAWRPDILDQLVGSINELIASLRLAHGQLEQSRAELADSEARLRMGLEAAGAGLWDWDIAAARLQLGPGCLAILGCEGNAQAAGEPGRALAYWQARTHVDDLPHVRREVLQHFIEAGADPGARLVAELRMRSDAGDWRWTMWRGRVIARDASGRATRAVGTVADIHQRKSAEEAVLALNRQLEDRVRSRTLALELARDEAERASQAKSDFLARMSHELRTPMNAILGFAQLLALESPGAKPQRWAGEIRHAGEHLLKLIDDLLDLSRIEVGKLQVTLQALQPLPLIDEAIGIVEAAMPQAGSRFQRPPALPAVQADPLRLRQILVNLLSNALKYAPGNTPIVISARTLAEGRLCLAVTDQGLGIPPERLDRLFQPFERLGREETAIEGSGVGLSLSKRLAELMGCRLGVDSRPGEGASFWIELPLAASPVVTAEPADARQPAQAGRALRVLYVEDNPTNRMLMQAWFDGRPGWQLALAPDGEQGLEIALAAPPDAILLDLHLPGIDGHAVHRALQADPRTAAIPVIAVTADAKPSERDSGLAAGFADYITKPVMFEQLRLTLERVAASLAT